MGIQNRLGTAQHSTAQHSTAQAVILYAVRCYNDILKIAFNTICVKGDF